MSNKSIQLIVAIDGPAASGKSTVSREAAKKLQFNYVDSGALYRGMTWKAVREGVDVKDAAAVVALMNQTQWDFFVEDKVVKFTIDEEDPTDHLRSEPVRERVADIAVIPEVRSFIVARLRETQAYGSLVMEGRDIGSVVFPDATFKYYLDADPEERARRRHKELVETEGKGDVEQVLNSLARRDKIDSTRKTAPLQIPLGAKVINTTGMTIEQVVDVVASEVEAYQTV
jgi:cytidylate kinase